MDCLPVPYFGDITNKILKVVTIGFNPALDEFYKYNGDAKSRSQRLALLSDYEIKARTDLRDADVDEAKKRRDGYFKDPNREWHNYFEKMESVINRVNPAWTYVIGSAIHIDLVACATKNRWAGLAPETKTHMIGNCREHFLASLAMLPNGTVLLCDGPRVMKEMQNLGLSLKRQSDQMINVRELGRGDKGWIGKIFLGEREFPFRGWSSQVGQLSAVWRFDLAYWLRGTFPKP
jgi:hypothetical protein